MIWLWSVHALKVLPGDVSQKAQDGNYEELQVEDRSGKKLRDDAVVFSREYSLDSSNGAVKRDECEPEGQAARNSQNGPFGPDVGNECGFA